VTHREFWALVDEARAARGDLVAHLERRLARLPSSEIASFDAWSRAYRSALHREDLWAAIYLIEGGCSDDGFDYFRAWLVAQGEAAVLAAVRDPESLGDLVDGKRGASLEMFLGVANRAHRRAFGSDLPDDGTRVDIPDLASWAADRISSSVNWAKHDVLQATYPRLWARFGWEPPPTGAIDHARFWAILDEAKARRGGRWDDDTVAELQRMLGEAPVAEQIGFDRWLKTYNQALVARNDLRALGRVLLGSASAETFTAFRGWLLAQGEAVVHATLRDPDSLADVVAREPAVPLARLVFSTVSAPHTASYDDLRRSLAPSAGAPIGRSCPTKRRSCARASRA
jgi:hypothetical protein